MTPTKRSHHKKKPVSQEPLPLLTAVMAHDEEPFPESEQAHQHSEASLLVQGPRYFKQPKGVLINVTVYEPVRVWLRNQAEMEEKTVSDIVREALKMYIDSK